MFKELREIRLKNHLTQQDMADRLGITLNYYNKLERSKRDPSFKLIKRICHEFDVPLFGIDPLFQKVTTLPESTQREIMEKYLQD